jgi:hypothetical protein
MGCNPDLPQLNEVVFWRLTYSLCAKNKVWKKWFPLSDVFRISAFEVQLNCYEYGDKTRLAQTNKIRVYALNFQFICAEYALETWLAKSDEISALELDRHLISPQYRFQTWVAPTEIFRVFNLDVQPICAVHELDTWLPLHDENGVQCLDF